MLQLHTQIRSSSGSLLYWDAIAQPGEFASVSSDSHYVPAFEVFANLKPVSVALSYVALLDLRETQQDDE